MNIEELTIKEFSEKTASRAATPGGGSVSAIVGALAIALSQMVANLTADKPGYDSVQHEMQNILERGKELQTHLLALSDADCDAFDGYMQAFNMPRATHEQRRVRKAAMQEAAKKAADVPLETAQCASDIFSLAQDAMTLGTSSAKADALMSTLLARAAVRGALINVRVNLPSLGDQELAQRYEARCKALEKSAEMAEIAALSQYGAV